jgi:hypothetical protein
MYVYSKKYRLYLLNFVFVFLYNYLLIILEYFNNNIILY